MDHELGLYMPNDSTEKLVLEGGANLSASVHSEVDGEQVEHLKSHPPLALGDESDQLGFIKKVYGLFSC